MPLFDAYVMVDWSAAATPRRGADSIWLGRLERGAGERLDNPPTRHAAMELLADWLSDLVARGRRVLVGCDFAFGYPQGFAARLTPHRPDWQGVWTALAARIEDGPDNANDRFAAAAAINAEISGADFPFWGCPPDSRHSPLSPRRPQGFDQDGGLAELRLCERRARGPQPVWKLWSKGNVGSQTLLGIPRLHALRRHPWIAAQTRVWPFETGLRPPAPDGEWQVVLAEVYPSLVNVAVPEGTVKDARQVSALARWFAQLDQGERLAELFAGDPALTPEERTTVEREEGWILGVAGPTPPAGGYLRDPDAIYRASWQAILAEVDLEGIPEELRPLAMRVVHASGMPDIVHDLVFSRGAAAAGRSALLAGAPVLVDAEMMAHGIIRRLLPAANPVLCTLNDPKVPELARRLGTTRSAAAVELWRERLDGAVVAIGNAPTALFHLLDMVAAGAPRPALVLGFPVGFVGAAESKLALAANTLDIPYVALRGRRGGSAMAAAAVNALAGGLA